MPTKHSSRCLGSAPGSRIATSSIGNRSIVRILYLADIRFPLERANGIQSMHTCHALAERGHDVSMVVRPDTHVPPRDPFAFYGLPRSERLHLEIAAVTGPEVTRRVGYLTFA